MKKNIMLLIVCLFTAGCFEKDINLILNYDQIKGLKNEDAVYFEGNMVGKVKEIAYSKAGKYQVHIVIHKNFANTATEHSKFFIITDPAASKNKAIEVELTQQGGAVLESGTAIDGSDKVASFFKGIQDGVEKGVSDFKKGFEKGVDDLKEDFGQLTDELGEWTNKMKELPESQEFKKFETDMNKLAEEMKKSGEDAREKIQKEVLPKLQEQMEELKKKMREFGREEEMKPLETQMETMKKI